MMSTLDMRCSELLVKEELVKVEVELEKLAAVEENQTTYCEGDGRRNSPDRGFHLQRYLILGCDGMGVKSAQRFRPAEMVSCLRLGTGQAEPACGMLRMSPGSGLRPGLARDHKTILVT